MNSDAVHLQDLTGRRHDWTPIAVLLQLSEQMTSHLLELARERQWQLISLGKFGGFLFPDVKPRGALVSGLPEVPFVRQLLDLGIPTVRVGQWPHLLDAEVPAVMPDHPACGPLAAQHFAQRDFKHVACIGFDPWGENEATYNTFASRSRELGMTCHLFRYKSGVRGGFVDDRKRWEVRQAEFTAWLQQMPRPFGLLAFDDIAADRYCHWTCEAGLRVPEDVAIVGIGNEVFSCEAARVPLSSIAHDNVHVIETAVDMLARLIAGEQSGLAPVKIPPIGVVTRQSSDVLAASNPDVVAALRYMWNHIAENLSVDQIAEQTGVSRRSLERAFQKDLGRGISQEFQRRRLDRARHMLKQTNLRIGQIAEALGFNSQKYFCEAFRAQFGLSPSQYRATRQPLVPATPQA